MNTTKQSPQYKYDVFISYSSDDYVAQILDLLEKFKYKIWIDKDRLSKHPDQDFNPHVKVSIDQSEYIQNCPI